VRAIGCGEALREPLCVGMRRVVGHAFAERRHHVEALAARGLGPAVEPFRLQNAAHRDRRLDHKLLRHAFARIEIEHQLIGALVIIHRRRAVHAAPGLWRPTPT
jgi:hypothetical protein